MLWEKTDLGLGISRKNFEYDHFSDSDNSKPNPDTPLEYQRKHVWKGNYSQRKFAEKDPKRNSMTSVKARTGGTDTHISEPISLSNDNVYRDDDTTNASTSYNPNQDCRNNSTLYGLVMTLQTKTSDFGE